MRPAFGTVASVISVRKPPFDNTLLRYALNMALDKNAVAAFMRAGRSAARTLVAGGPGLRHAPRSFLYPWMGAPMMCFLSISRAHARCLLLPASLMAPG